MTLEEIEQRVEEIEQIADDYEVAHKMEDVLYQDFIEYIAGTHLNTLGDKARAVLKSKQLKFPRYTA